MVERFPFLFFLWLGKKEKKDNKDSGRWGRKERRDLINELQHLRGGGSGVSGVLLRTPCTECKLLFLSPPLCLCPPRCAVPARAGWVLLQALLLIFSLGTDSLNGYRWGLKHPRGHLMGGTVKTGEHEGLARGVAVSVGVGFGDSLSGSGCAAGRRDPVLGSRAL